MRNQYKDKTIQFLKLRNIFHVLTWSSGKPSSTLETTSPSRPWGPWRNNTNMHANTN